MLGFELLEALFHAFVGITNEMGLKALEQEPGPAREEGKEESHESEGARHRDGKDHVKGGGKGHREPHPEAIAERHEEIKGPERAVIGFREFAAPLSDRVPVDHRDRGRDGALEHRVAIRVHAIDEHVVQEQGESEEKREAKKQGGER